jgi:hypothetical protein
MFALAAPIVHVTAVLTEASHTIEKERARDCSATHVPRRSSRHAAQSKPVERR